MSKELVELREDRSAKYGDIQINQDAVGLMFTGLLENHYQIKLPHPVPGSVVALMMAAIKLNRAAFNGELVEDNYLDAKNYIEISRMVDQRGKA